MTDLAEKCRKLQETYNTYKPLKILYTRNNECVDYVTATGKPITEGQVVRIAYGLVAETGQIQGNSRTWRAKSDQ